LARLTVCTAAVFALTAGLYALPLRDRPLIAAFTFLFVVLIVSAAWGFRYAVFVSFLAAVGFAWLAPVGVLYSNEPRDLFALTAFLVIGLIGSHLADRARREALRARDAEEVALQNAKELRDVIETIPAMAWTALPDGSNGFVNRRWAEYTGLSAAATAGSGWHTAVHPHDLERYVDNWRTSLRTGQPFEHEARFRRAADEEYRWFLVRAVALRDEHETILKWYGIVTDIEDRKRAEQTLSRNEFYLAEAQRLSHTGSFAFDARAPVYWSEENLRMWGFDPQQGLPDRETVLQRLHPEDRDEVVDNVRKAVREGRDYFIEFRIVLPQGTVKYIQGLGHPIISASGEVVEVVGTNVDVTDRKRAEKEREGLRQLQADLARVNRVTTMGELTASLTHEVNQPIAAAITDANTCVRWLTRDEPDLQEAREAAKRTVTAATRAGEIMSRIRSLFKKSAPEHELVDVNGLIAEIVTLVRSEAMRNRVSVRTDLGADLAPVMGDRVQLQQVLLNLMMNGIEATKDVDGHREITITSRHDDSDHLRVSVADTGVGLPPNGDEIFNPFFTTKPDGTGMGLAISRSIIESHGGRLWATSDAGLGATVSFNLPTAAVART
jgi:PAS domain S-box-containing protein